MGQLLGRKMKGKEGCQLEGLSMMSSTGHLRSFSRWPEGSRVRDQREHCPLPALIPSKLL